MEWKEVRLGDVVEIVNGFAFKSKAFTLEGIPVIKIKNIKAGKVILNDLDYISTSDINPKYTKIRPSDILITMTGNRMDGSPETWVGKVSLFRHQGDFYLNQRVSALRLIDDSVDNNFLSYYLSSWQSQLYFALNSNSSGGQANITPAVVQEYRLMVPELEKQRSIASILSSLDRKIELNNKINADLEEMAQAIFKNWFVDFEPFKDGKFVDSELGMIPEGWKVGSYSEMIESLISGDWGKETPQGNYTHEVACVRGCDFQDINNGVRGKTPQRYILEKNYQAKHLKDKDILVEISGGTATVSTGRTSLVTEELLKKYKHDIVCTNFCKVLRPLSQFSSYVYYSWKYKYDNDIMFGYENGTSGIKNFAIKDFIEKEPVLIPKEQDIVEFQKIIDNLQKQKQIKGTENTTLSLLRDTLLPRLMSGELEVPE